MGTPKRAPRTDVLAVACRTCVPRPGRHERTTCFRVSARRSFDRVRPVRSGAGRGSPPGSASAGIDERNHAEGRRSFGKGFGPGSQFDRQASDNPHNRARRRHAAYILRSTAVCARLRRLQMCAVWIAQYAAISRSAQRGRRASDGRRKSLRHLALHSLARSSDWIWPAGIHRTFLGWSFTRLSPYCSILRILRTPAARSNVRYQVRSMQPPAHVCTWQPIVNLSHARRYTRTLNRSNFASASRSPGHSASTSAYNWQASA